MYRNASVVAKWDTVDYEHIPIQRGLRQGDPLSPLLFLLYVNGLRQYVESSPKLIMYADDMVVYDSDLNKFRWRVGALGAWLKELDLHVNGSKCGMMGVNEFSQTKLKEAEVLCQDQEMKVVTEYVYLGYPMCPGFSTDFTADKLLTKAYMKWAAMNKFISNKNYPSLLRVNFMKSILYPSITYGLEVFGHKSSHVRDRQVLLNRALCAIGGVSEKTSTLLLHLEYEVIPIKITAILKNARVWSSPTLLSRSLFHEVLSCFKEGKKCYSFEQVRELLRLGLINELVGRCFQEGLSSSEEIRMRYNNLSEDIAETFEQLLKVFERRLNPARLLLRKHRQLGSIEGDEQANHEEEEPDLWNPVDLKYGNLLLLVIPMDALKRRGLPDAFIQQCGHTSTTEVHLMDYVYYNHFFQKAYLHYWIYRPDLSTGFHVMEKLRLRDYNTQYRQVMMYEGTRKGVEGCYKLNRCMFCGMPDLRENEYHLINVCLCWDQWRKECFQKIKDITRKDIPREMMLSDFFRSFSPNFYAPKERMKKGNHMLFHKAIVRYCEMESIDYSSMNLQFCYDDGETEQSVYRKVISCIAEFLGKVDKKRSAIIAYMEKRMKGFAVEQCCPYLHLPPQDRINLENPNTLDTQEAADSSTTPQVMTPPEQNAAIGADEVFRSQERTSEPAVQVQRNKVSKNTSSVARGTTRGRKRRNQDSERVKPSKNSKRE